MIIFRQGDVTLVKVSELPAGAKRIEGDVILAYGEVTGHAHRVIEKQKVAYFDAGAERFLQVLEKTALTHEEHGAIMLEKGVYKQVFQVEDFGTEVRRVAD
jgi:hypothetical protein